MVPLKLTLFIRREREKKEKERKIIKNAALIVVSLWTNVPDRKYAV